MRRNIVSGYMHDTSSRVSECGGEGGDYSARETRGQSLGGAPQMGRQQASDYPPPGTLLLSHLPVCLVSCVSCLIELQYGEPAWFNWTQFRHVPSRGDIIIFPSWMRHTVYAHYEANKVRISVAGNVNILNVDSEDNRQKHT